MRFLLLILAGCCLTASAMAQKQEKTLAERLDPRTSVDMSLENSMNGKAFKGVGGTDVTKKSSLLKAYAIDKKVTEKSYGTRSFLGIKNPWIGSRTYESKEVSLLSKSLVANIDRKVAVTNAEADQFNLADKKIPKADAVVKTRASTEKGVAQGAMDMLSEKNKDMTIDEVREILNKSR